MIMAYHLEKRWKKIYHSALLRSGKLQPTKAKFAEITQKEIQTFSDEVGPGQHTSTCVCIGL